MSGLVGYGNTPVKIISGFNSSNLKEWYFDDQGNIVLPQNGNILDHNGNSVLGIDANAGNLVFNNNAIGNDTQGNPVQIETVSETSTTFQWSFESNGNLVQPKEGSLVQNHTFTKSSSSNVMVNSGFPLVVWSSIDNEVSSVKLLIQVEGDETADSSGWHCQTCEAIISSRGYTNNFNGYGYGIPVITVYGITYTGTGPLMTFTVQRNPSTLAIEVVGTPTAFVDTYVYVNTYSVESKSANTQQLGL